MVKNNKEEIFDIFGPINKNAQQRVDELKIFNNIKFHGSVDYDDTHNLLNMLAFMRIIFKIVCFLPENLYLCS